MPTSPPTPKPPPKPQNPFRMSRPFPSFPCFPCFPGFHHSKVPLLIHFLAIQIAILQIPHPKRVFGSRLFERFANQINQLLQLLLNLRYVRQNSGIPRDFGVGAETLDLPRASLHDFYRENHFAPHRHQQTLQKRPARTQKIAQKLAEKTDRVRQNRGSFVLFGDGNEGLEEGKGLAQLLEFRATGSFIDLEHGFHVEFG